MRCSLLSLIAVAITIGGYHYGLFKAADQFIFDLRMDLRGPSGPSGQVVLALLDEKSSVELQRKAGIWPRDSIAAGLRQLCDAGAEIIGIDLLFSQPDVSAEVDSTLARQIYDCNNVVLARMLAAGDTDEITPITAFQEAMIGDGYVDVTVDSDQVVRRLRYLRAKPGPDGVELLPAFALEVARTFLDIDYAFDFDHPDGIYMGTGPTGLLLPAPEIVINYAGLTEAFPHFSFVDAVEGRLPPETVRGKIVLIGSSLPMQKDFFASPLSRFKRFDRDYGALSASVVETVGFHQDTGVAIHANAIETLLAGNSIREVDPGWVRAAIIVTGLMIGAIFFLTRVGLLQSTLLLGVLLLLIAYGSYELFAGRRLALDTAPIAAVLLIQFLSGMGYQWYLARLRAAHIHELFGRYVSPSVANELVKAGSEVSVSGQRRELTMLFSDLRGFTTLSEDLSPEVTVRLLNAYFDRMIPVVFDNRGTVDKLMGDAIMAFFGAPQHFDNHPAKAADAALGMLAELRKFRQSEIEGAELVFAGIGINSGEVTLGNLGGEKFKDYTVIGDAVNLASRLEGLNKVYGTEILISEGTASHLDSRYLIRELDRVRVKGKHQAICLYELVDYRAQASPAQVEAVAHFHEGLGLYRDRQWEAAERCFLQVLRLLGEDGPAKLYLSRIADYRAHPPGAEWDGVTKFDQK